MADFEPGRRIPLCAFEFQLLPDRKPQRIFHKVDIIGATSQPFFYIRYYHTQSKGLTFDNSNQKPRLIVSGPRKDANPSVNDKLHSYTVTACLKFGAPF